MNALEKKGGMPEVHGSGLRLMKYFYSSYYSGILVLSMNEIVQQIQDIRCFEESSKFSLTLRLLRAAIEGNDGSWFERVIVVAQ